MRIAVVNLTAGQLSGGYRKYLRRLIPLLRDQRDVDHVDVFLPELSARHLRGSAVEPFQTWRTSEARWPAHTLRKRVQACEPDVVFVPTARWYDFGIPTVVMVRNMEPLCAPVAGNSAAEASRNVARRLAARRACRRADGVVTVSQFVRDFILAEWAIDPTRVSVVYHGVDRVAHATMPATVARVGGPFLFTAGSIRPARGLEDVIRGLAVLRGRGTPQTLVIAGESTAGSHGHAEQLRELASGLGVADDIVWAGLLSPAEMAWCFDACRAFVMTSRMEACPNLVLEAMAHGCVSISTDSRPMPEFFQDSAWYYAARTPDRLADAVADALGASDAETARRRERATARAAVFTWQRTATDTVAQLRRTLGAVPEKQRRSA